MNAPPRIDIPCFATIEKAIGALKPVDPVYCLFPEKFRIAAKRFLDGFPGDAMYAVKANPLPTRSTRSGPRASVISTPLRWARSRLVQDRFPDAHCHFMAPVRLPGHAKAAFEKYGVTDYVVDCDYELDKLIAETKQPKKLRIFVRLATQFGGALLELSSKFGTAPDEARAALEARGRTGRGALPHLPCRLAMPVAFFLCAGRSRSTRRTIAMAGVDIAALDIGGGFPARTPTTTCRPITGISTPSAKRWRRWSATTCRSCASRAAR